MPSLPALPPHSLGPSFLAALMAAAALSAGGPVSTVGKATRGRAPSSVASTSSVVSTLPLSPRGIAPSGAPAPGLAGPSAAIAAPRPSIGRSRLDPRLSFVWPLSPLPAVHRRFEQPLHQWSRGHRGADLLAAVGQPVLSAGDGVVAFSGVVAGRGVITVRHAGGLRTTYEPVDERLTAGTRVGRGTRIGVVSTVPGHCVPLTCMHWGAILERTYRDPLSLVIVGRPILLPLS